MFRKLVKTDALAIEDQTFPVRYFEVRTQRGGTAQRSGWGRTTASSSTTIRSATSRPRRCGSCRRRFTAACWQAEPPQRETLRAFLAVLPQPAQRRVDGSPPLRCRLLFGEYGVFELLGDSRLHHRLRRNLDRLTGGGI